MTERHINSAEIVMPCHSLTDTLNFFVDELGFRLDSIYPADAPRVAVISGFGLRVKLDAEASGEPGTIHLHSGDSSVQPVSRVAPNGATVVTIPAEEPVTLPALVPKLIVRNATDSEDFGDGRAGMQYRDLIPGRYGGRFIASHIRIPVGGPVPDHVHHHHIHFQLIFCVNGWVDVVYEDQGSPMRMRAGDCFLQPPHIRHRVLESSDQLEVLEVSCPAEHETLIDHEMSLPNGSVEPGRLFGDQRFVFHQEAKAKWSDADIDGLEYQKTMLEEATGGIVSVCVFRAGKAVAKIPLDHDGELRFLFVLKGNAQFCSAGDLQQLSRSSSCAVPRATRCDLLETSNDFSFVEIFVPGAA